VVIFAAPAFGLRMATPPLALLSETTLQRPARWVAGAGDNTMSLCAAASEGAARAARAVNTMAPRWVPRLPSRPNNFIDPPRTRDER
jgi:hypothetical protein